MEKRKDTPFHEAGLGQPLNRRWLWTRMTMALGILCMAGFIYGPVFGQTIGPRGRLWRGENRCRKAADLNLSSDQIKGLDLINRTYARETRILRNDMFSKRMELREFLTNPNVKIEAIQLKNSEITELRSKIEEKAMDYLIKVRSLLTQGQLKFWCPEQEIPFMAGMMSRPEWPPPMPPRRMAPPERAKEE